MVDRSIGTGAVGLTETHRTPSPGSTALLTVEFFANEADLTDDWPMTHTEHTWEGYTARDVIAQRVKRWREARVTFERDGDILTRRRDDGAIERLTAVDA